MSDTLKYSRMLSFSSKALKNRTLEKIENKKSHKNKKIKILEEFEIMTLAIFIENHFYGLLLFFVILANATLILGILNIRIYCCKYCRLSDNGRRLAHLQSNRCELFIHEQLKSANHQPLRLV